MSHNTGGGHTCVCDPWGILHALESSDSAASICVQCFYSFWSQERERERELSSPSRWMVRCELIDYWSCCQVRVCPCGEADWCERCYEWVRCLAYEAALKMRDPHLTIHAHSRDIRAHSLSLQLMSRLMAKNVHIERYWTTHISLKLS